MAFDAHLEGFTFTIDSDSKFGGRGLGPKPKGLTLASLAGCTAMDVIAILTKMRVAPKGFEVTADARLAEDHPKKFEEITLIYRFEGEELPLNRLFRAIQLSEERYCGVTATLRPAVTLRAEVYVNGERVEADDSSK
jgi:putative redox protein